MIDQPKHGGWAMLIVAKVVCCVGLLLFLTGILTLSGVLGWFRSGGPIWLVLVGAGAAVGVILWFRQRRSDGGVTEQPRQPKTKGTP